MKAASTLTVMWLIRRMQILLGVATYGRIHMVVRYMSLLAGLFFGECKELNRAGPPKMMGLKKKNHCSISPTPAQKRKINMFHVSISK